VVKASSSEISDSALPKAPPPGGAADPCPDQRWSIYPALKGEALGLAQATGLSPLLAQVLLNRGIEAPELAVEFLEPEQLTLPSPLEEFPDLAASVTLLVEAIAQRQKIAICGDYDADGMTSTALLIRALRFLGADADYAIPSRMQEGYGLNNRIIETFYSDGVSIILTVDNGIAAFEPVAYARELGMTVIITDHHDVPPQIPPANAILNPKLIAVDSPYRGVAGVGVAYILAICLAQALGQTQNLTGPLLELFTLGTIADLAPLTGVNRRWIRRGLRLLPKSRIIGVQALIQVAGLGEQDQALKPEDIGFRLGPRINAVGRIGDPQTVIEMLISDDVGIALERAMQCEQTNQTRREMCDRIEEEAIAYCEAQKAAGEMDIHRDRVLVVIQPGWHHGVIGIVASRLVERYGVPVLIGTYEDKDQKEIRGSARSIPEFNVFEGLQACDDLMTKYGGHRAAGGFTFPTKHLRQVKSRLVNYANQVLTPEHLKPLVTVDVRASLADLNFDLLEQIDRLHPCGIGNSEPVFWTPNVRIVEQKAIGKTRAHLKLTVAEDNGSSLEAIAWRWGHYCPLPSRVDIAYTLKINEWKGQRTLQLELLGVRTPQVAAPPIAPNPVSSPVKSQGMPAAATLKLPLEMPKATPQKVAEASPPPQPQNQATAEQFLSAGLNVGTDPTQTTFSYNRRAYTAVISQGQSGQELRISNAEGETLGVMLSARQGYLSLPHQPPRPVDVGETYYFNLIRAGLNALELHQKNQLLVEKEAQLRQKNQQIAGLSQQIAQLQHTLTQQPEPPNPAPNQPELQPAQLASLTQQIAQLEQQLSQRAAAHQAATETQQAALQQKDQQLTALTQQIAQLEQRLQSATESQQASQNRQGELLQKDQQIVTLTQQVTQLEQQLDRAAPQPTSASQSERDAPTAPAKTAQVSIESPPTLAPLSAEAAAQLQQQVRHTVGDSLWFCLQSDSQQDFYTAYEQAEMLAQVTGQWSKTGPQGPSLDYSPAALPLAAVVEREIVHPFFEDLSAYLATQAGVDMEDSPLVPGAAPSLAKVAPILADSWLTLPTQALSAKRKPTKAKLAVTQQALVSLGAGDRDRLNAFLDQWEHPMASWLLQKPDQAAAKIDVISQCQQWAAQSNRVLHKWAFDMVTDIVIGKQGVFRQIYGT
jgi:single-stranded-DNA-specific exonuclease